MKNYAHLFIIFGLFSLVSVFAQSKSSVSPSEINPLEFGNAIEREILPKQKHFYKIHLETGQFVKISVISRNCTIAVSIFEPDGKFVLESKNIHLTNNDETINAAVRKTGDYQVRIVFCRENRCRRILSSKHYRIAGGKRDRIQLYGRQKNSE